MSRKNEELAKRAHTQGENQIEDEIAATIVTGTRRGNPYFTNSVSKRPSNLLRVLYVFFTFLLVGLTALTTWFVFDKTNSKTEITSTSYVEQINKMAFLATAEAHVKEVLEVEDNKLFGKNVPFSLFGAAKREVLIIVPATVVAGVDLQGVTERDVMVDEEAKMIEIKLPRATLLQDPSINMENIITYSDEGLFRGEIDWDEGVEILETAQKQIKEEASEIGLYQTAEQNAEKALQNFFQSLGYTVKITF